MVPLTVTEGCGWSATLTVVVAPSVIETLLSVSSA